MNTATINILDVKIANITLLDAVANITAAAKEQQRLSHFAFVNADCINLSVTNPGYKAVLDATQQVFGDGSGIRYASKISQQPIADNVNGTDLYPLLCEQARAEGLSIYYLGGLPGVAKQAGLRSSKRYPGLKVAGYHDGFFDDSELDSIIQQINDSHADILLVAMGAPLQETWIAENADRLKVGAAIGVGGLFDFLSKSVSRAPQLARRLGLEWFFRWINEPSRLLKRYFVGNPLFIFRVLSWIDRNQIRSVEENRSSNSAEPSKPVSKFDHWQDFQILDDVQKKYRNIESKPRHSNRRQFSYWRQTHAYQVAKRAVDIMAASVALILLTPLMLLTALLVYLGDPGPIFFTQNRVGYRGRLFSIYKFRSMYMNADERKAELLSQNESSAGVLFKMKHDPRITSIGSVIRKFSIDELPQLVNVLKGDMTLVGPRPPVPSEVKQYSLSERQRLDVVPGITCIWQVSGRSDINFEGQVKMDIEYIQTRSLWRDVQLLLKTIPAVLTAKGSY